MSRRAAEWLQIVGAAALLASLFLTWSHQYAASVLQVPGMRAALAGVPRDATAWEVYSAADVLLALLAGAVMVAAVWPGQWFRAVVLTLTVLALAFVAHAVAVPPTSGVDVIVPGSGRYLAREATAGPGETLAIAALALACLGLSSTRGRHPR